MISRILSPWSHFLHEFAVDQMKQLRDGIEDYEAIRLLDAQSRGAPPDSPAARALDAARALVSIPNAGGLRSLSILPDPAAVSRVRLAVNRALSDLSARAVPEEKVP